MKKNQESSCHSKKGANKPQSSVASFVFNSSGAGSVSDELSGTLMAQSRMHVITSTRSQRKEAGERCEK